MVRVVSDMEKTIQSNTYTAIRNCIGTGRYITEKENLTGVDKLSEGTFVMFRNGNQTTVGGHGKLIDDFIKEKKLCVSFDKNEKVVIRDDPNFHSANLRILRFDETYEFVNYDARRRKYFSHLLSNYIELQFQVLLVIFVHLLPKIIPKI